MKFTIIASIASFAAAFAVAGFMYSADRATETVPTVAANESTFDDNLPLADRIAALEQAVSDEQFARQLLEDEVFYLTSELERRPGGSDFAPAGDSGEAQAENAVAETRSSRRAEWLRRNSTEGRIDRLVDAGFLPSQASAIARREAELQMEAIQARYDAERSGDPMDFWRSRDSMNDTLRSELGDADFERYLVANDRSISVTVSNVIDSSPAQSAGLQAGDEIVRYDGERVFSMTDLMHQATNGAPGENVVVDITRDGTPMQIVLPRGPVGISGGRRPW